MSEMLTGYVLELAREVSRASGEPLLEAVERALQERLQTLRANRLPEDEWATLKEAVATIRQLPTLDDRPPATLLGKTSSEG